MTKGLIQIEKLQSGFILTDENGYRHAYKYNDTAELVDDLIGKKQLMKRLCNLNENERITLQINER